MAKGVEEPTLICLNESLHLEWNVRGLNAPIKIKEVKRYIYDFKLALLAICEARVNKIKKEI